MKMKGGETEGEVEVRYMVCETEMQKGTCSKVVQY